MRAGAFHLRLMAARARRLAKLPQGERKAAGKDLLRELREFLDRKRHASRSDV